METQAPAGLKIKLFTGFLIRSDIRVHLNQSNEWKLVTLSHDQGQQILTEVQHQNKSYIGKFSPKENMTIEELGLEAKELRKKLKEYCPELAVDNIDIILFPQIFIS